MVKNEEKKTQEFDRYRELKYIGIWFAIVAGTVTILSKLDISSNIIIFVIIIIFLLISNYLKDKEIEHLKSQ